MSYPPPNQDSSAGGGNEPAAEQIKRVAVAIETYAGEQKAGQADKADQNSKIQWWTRTSAIAVIVYTLITTGVFIASVRSIQETRRATYYASRTAELTRQGTIEANRAWVNPFFAYLGTPLMLNQKIHYSIAYQNPGRAPATGINWKFDDGYFDTPQDDDGRKIKIPPNTTCDGLRPTDAGAIEFPPLQGITDKERETRFRPHEYNAVSEKTIVDEEMLRGKHRFYIQGCAAYWTMTIIGHTKFCYFHVLTADNANLNACPGGNAAE